MIDFTNPTHLECIAFGILIAVGVVCVGHIISETQYAWQQWRKTRDQ